MQALLPKKDGKTLETVSQESCAVLKMSKVVLLQNTGIGKPEYIPPDEALDKVAGILGATCEGYTLPFGGDAEEAVVMRRRWWCWIVLMWSP
ncbi:unnamed protein product [Colias eurytheme]|nr:unnamed protein product [Colias eurytheme]